MIDEEPQKTSVKKKAKTKVHSGIALMFIAVSTIALAGAIFTLTWDFEETTCETCGRPANSAEIVVKAPTLEEAKTEFLEALDEYPQAKSHKKKVEETLVSEEYSSFIETGKLPDQEAPNFCTKSECGKYGMGTCYSWCLGGSVDILEPAFMIKFTFWF